MSLTGLSLRKVFGAVAGVDGLHLGAGKTVLPPCLENGDGGGIGKVERAQRRPHGEPYPCSDMRVPFEPFRQAHGFGSEHQHITRAVVDVCIGRLAVGGIGEDPLGMQGFPGGLDVFVDCDDSEVVVVQAGPPKLGIGKIETEGLHQVKLGARNGGEPNGVAGIARDFWSVEEDAEHRPILVRRVLDT